MGRDSYICSNCGKQHFGSPFSFAADFADAYVNLNRNERETRVVAGSDQCIIDQEQFFIRGCIDLPIRETNEVFLWGVRARVHESDFYEISDHWDIDGRERKIGPYKGLLANSLSIYPETLNLKLEIRIEPVGTRPRFFMEDPDHPLSTEQRTGLRKEKAEQYACLLLRMAKL